MADLRGWLIATGYYATSLTVEDYLDTDWNFGTHFCKCGEPIRTKATRCKRCAQRGNHNNGHREWHKNCLECGKELGRQNHGGHCKRCAMLGNRNARKHE